MALSATIASLDAVPEALRAHYLPTADGRFRLDAEGIEDVAGLKSALEKERAARKALKAALDARESGAGEPDAAGEPETGDPEDEMVTADGAQEPNPGDGDPAVEPVEEPVDEPVTEAAAEPDSVHSTGPDTGPNAGPNAGPDTAPDRAAVEALRRQLETRLIEAEASAAIIAAAGVPELLLPVLLPKLAVREADGGFEVEVLASVEGGEVPATVAELVETLRRSEIYGRAFAGTGKSGSGAPVGAAGSGGPVSLPAGDPLTLGRHIADIAAGRIAVDG